MAVFEVLVKFCSLKTSGFGASYINPIPLTTLLVKRKKEISLGYVKEHNKTVTLVMK